MSDLVTITVPYWLVYIGLAAMVASMAMTAVEVVTNREILKLRRKRIEREETNNAREEAEREAAAMESDALAYQTKNWPTNQQGEG